MFAVVCPFPSPRTPFPFVRPHAEDVLLPVRHGCGGGRGVHEVEGGHITAIPWQGKGSFSGWMERALRDIFFLIHTPQSFLFSVPTLRLFDLAVSLFRLISGWYCWKKLKWSPQTKTMIEIFSSHALFTKQLLSSSQPTNQPITFTDSKHTHPRSEIVVQDLANLLTISCS